MACSSPEDGEDGFATQAATLVCLVLAVTLTAALLSSTEALKAAQAHFDRTRIEYALSGVQQIAALKIIAATRPGAFEWREDALGGETTVRAEPEAVKLGLKPAQDLDSHFLGDLGISDPAQLRARLLMLSQTSAPSVEQLRILDAAPLWQDCVHDFASPYGRGLKLATLDRSAPEEGQPSPRAGEAWRIQVHDPSGWMDDRTVVFTGDDHQPAAVVERRFFHSRSKGDGCDALIAKYARR